MFTQKLYFYNKKQPQVEVFWKKKVFLEISQNSQGNSCASLFFCEFLLFLCNFSEHLLATASV